MAIDYSAMHNVLKNHPQISSESAASLGTFIEVSHKRLEKIAKKIIEGDPKGAAEDIREQFGDANLIFPSE